MKKFCKTMLIIILSVFILTLGTVVYFLVITHNVKLNEDKLVNLDRKTTFYDCKGDIIFEESKGISVTDINELNKHTIDAFIAIEDKRFYTHNGIDIKRLISASINNLKSFSFKEGASTISQQLIKNTHLTNEKTITRKLSEIKLARKLEQTFSKNEIIEKYLNTIYFGDNCYGITSAAKHYFNKDAKDLNINESAILAAIIKAPSNYSPYKNKEKCKKRKNLVLKAMLEQNYITKEEYDENINLEIETINESDIKEYDYLYLIKNELDNFEDSSPYTPNNIKVYTSLDKKAQYILESNIKSIDKDYLKSAILIDKNSNICAYYSNCGEMLRQLGSTIKPLLVYAPAIEENIVSSYTHITDEKININGYAPSNYANKYYGKVTVQESLAKSLNSCSVKLLNYLGVKKALSYASKTDLNFTNNDNSLCLALGATEKGDTLRNITSAYSTFINSGKYTTPSVIKNLIYNNKKLNLINKKYNTIYSDDTVGIINQMLKNAVKNGTAKKLSHLPFTLYAKTGTVGNEKGNTDAYIISYNSEYILGCWLGNKGGDYLPNEVSGGTTPAILAYNIWNELYKNKKAPDDIIIPESLCEIYIDKISYDNDNIIMIADKNSPERYKEKIITKKNSLPLIVSNRFTNPKIEITNFTMNNNCFTISLCLAEYYNIDIYRKDNISKKLIKSIKGNNKTIVYTDDTIKTDTSYEYSIIPYFVSNDGTKFYGDEIYLPKIKTPEQNYPGENWWINQDEC